MFLPKVGNYDKDIKKRQNYFLFDKNIPAIINTEPMMKYTVISSLSTTHAKTMVVTGLK